VVLGRHPARREQPGPRGDDEGPAGARERRAERLDGAEVGAARAVELREVVDEGAVDHAVRGGGAGAQALGVLEIAAVDLGPGGRERGGGAVGAGEADDLVARADELGNDGRTDEAGRAGDEYAHGRSSVSRGCVVRPGLVSLPWDRPMSVAVISVARDDSR